MHFEKVLIAGAGPSGLLLALMLAQHNIKVEIFEQLDRLDDRPRGAGYGSAAVKVLRRAGVLKKLQEEGLLPDTMNWRRPDGSIIGSLGGLNTKSKVGGFVMLPVYELSCVLLEELQKHPAAMIHWGQKIVSAGQDPETAWIEIEGGKRFEADYVVGCDGSNSIVRKSLFDRNFPGKTWDCMIVATNVHYHFEKFGWKDMSWIVDPVDWAVVGHIARDGTWRVSYGEVAGLSDEELRQRMPQKLRKLLPGNPSPDQYEVKRFSPYTLHQRCAERMRVGRILLVADAAHLNNPMGGLGLTSGIADIGALVDCMCGIYDGRASEDILDKYDEVRREIYHTVTNPISTQNLERIRKDASQVDPSKDPFYSLLAKVQQDPAAFDELERMNMSLFTDLTEFYHS